MSDHGERLLAAAKVALSKMCKVPADEAFTDAVDELDAAITSYEAAEHGMSVRDWEQRNWKSS